MRQRIKKAIRIPKRVFLIICEGKTEEEYIELLKRYFRLPIVIKSKVTGNRVNSRLIKQYVQELGLNNVDDFRVFFIYDMDVPHIVDRLKNLNGIPILSNPCIEYWFLLHSLSHCKHIDSKDVVKMLMKAEKEWNNYKKGFLSYSKSRLLISNLPKAMERARGSAFPENPSTQMPIFIEALEKEKNR